MNWAGISIGLGVGLVCLAAGPVGWLVGVAILGYLLRHPD